MVKVYIPVPEKEEAQASRLAPRLSTLEGKRVALVTNGWRSLDITYREFARALREKHKASDVFEVRKATASRPLPEEQMSLVLKGADAVIVGLGN